MAGPRLVQPTHIGPFSGIDLRHNAASAEPSSLRHAINVDLMVGGALKRRDGLSLVATVSAETIGLYSANGVLRTVCPGGQGLQDARPAEIQYDAIGDGSAFPLGSLAYLHAVENAAASTGGQSYPYVCIERTTGVREHHWLTASPALATDAVNTRVVLPFDPGKALVKSANKLFADDPANGVLRFSSTLNGPNDWTSERDAGSLAVRQLVSGSRDIVGLSYYKNNVAVLFQDAIQLWKMNADPSQIQFVTVLNGPGTEFVRTPANVLGDMYYFSRGGFRSLSQIILTGDVRESSIGSRIQVATAAIDTTNIRPVSIWSQTRSQYLCAFGTTVWVYTHNEDQGEDSRTTGWTTWELPVTVDYLVEHLGQTYIRSGNKIYRFDDTALTDDGDLPVNFDVLTAFNFATNPGPKKLWRWVDVIGTGGAGINFHIDPKSEGTGILPSPINYADTTFLSSHLICFLTSDAIALRFTGSDFWRIDEAYFDFRMRGGFS